MAEADVLEVATSVGPARLWIHRSHRPCRATVVLGHGAGRGVDTPDLAVLASSLPAVGYRVILVEQPWRVAGRRVAAAPARLDQAWLESIDGARENDLMDGSVVVGGRSAGARVACRTATRVAATGVLALAFPLIPPWRPDSTRAAELQLPAQLLIVQGERDRFGDPAQIKRIVPRQSVVGVPGADHEFTVARSAVITESEAGELISQACVGWLSSLLGPTRRESSDRQSR